ncbi:MAG TPA: metallophosphoesterase family protein [Mesorhizobium sp.]|jgi:serine/threonine protein phosphatase 1|nr:metallophosphoesterase family protein [Mesorhizobium sp.]
MRLYAIGDVHGRLDLLRQMHERINDDLARRPPADWRVIHLGDYIDRGPESKGVLDRLIAARDRDPRHVALMGNHDAGFIEFLRDPDAAGLFARFGGEDTARSYGVALDFGSSERFRAGHAALLRAVPADHIAFLLGLELSVSFGDFFFCHAGIRPGVALEKQTPDDLVWIREDFLRWTGLHPKVVVHGHTPSARPELRPNRVNVDTGAFKTGLLTALVLEGDEKSLLFAQDD